MAASGSGGYGGPSFARIESELRGVALQFGSILSVTQQLRATIDTFRQLELQLTMANFAAGGTAAEFQRMEETARRMSLASRFSAAQVAEAFYELASAGLSANEVLSASTGVLLLAQATMTDVGSAADLVASSLAQFNLRADESYRLTNLFVAATNNSLATIPKLSFALRQVGPIAAQAGLSIEQTVGALDKLFDAGLRGEQAGTALRNVIARLIDPMGEGAIVLENLGVQIFDANGKMRNLVTDILPELSKLGLSLSDISNIAGIEAASGFQTLLNAARDTTEKGLKGHITEISNTSDAYRQAVAQMNTMDGALSRIRNSLNELRFIMGEQLAPVIMTVADGFGSLVTHMRGMEAGAISGFAQMMLFGVGIGVVLKAVTALAPAMLAASRGLTSLIAGMVSARAAATAFGAGLGRIGFIAAGQGIASLTAGFVAFAGVAAGVIGVAAALGAVAVAVGQLQKAKHEAALQEIQDLAYADYARNNKGKLSPGVDTRTLRSAPANPIPALNRQQRDLQLQFEVDRDTGTGASQYLNATNSMLNDAEQALRIQNDRIRAIESRTSENREAIRHAFQEGFGRFFADINYIMVNGAAGQTFGPQMEAAFSRFAEAPSNQIRQATETMMDEFSAAIQANKNIASDRKASMLRETEEMSEVLASIPNDALINFQGKIAEAVEKAEGDPDKLNKNLGKALNDAIKESAPKDRDLDNVIETLKGVRGQLENKIAAIRREIQNNDAALQRELITTGNQAYQGNKEATAAFQTIVRDDPAAVARALDAVKRNGFNLQAGLESIMNEAINRRLITRETISGMIDRMLATPIIDFGKAQSAALRAQNEARQAALRLAELQGNTNVPGMQAAIREAGALNRNDILTNTVEDLANAAGSKGANAVKTQRFRDAWARFSRTQTEADFRAAAAAMGLGAGSNNVLGQVYSEVQAKLATATTRAEIEALQYAKSQQRSSGAGRSRGPRLDTNNRVLDQLLNLPTPEELEFQRDEMALRIEARMVEFLGNPIKAAEIARREVEMEMRGDLLEMQREQEKFFRDSIAKNLNNVETNQALVNAFAGRGIEGGPSTADLLAGGEGAQRYGEALMAMIEKSIPANAPERAKRIENAQRLTNEMIKQFALRQRETTQELMILDFERQRTQAELNRITSEFTNENMLEMLTRQLDVMKVRGGGITDFLGLHIRIGRLQVEIDRQGMISDLQKRFTEMFANLGAQVRFDGDTIADQMMGVTDENRAKVQELITTYGQAVTSVNELAAANARAFDPNSVELYRQSIDNVIEGMRQGYNRLDVEMQEGFMGGLDAGMMKFIREMPTAFETGMEVMGTALNGFVDLSANLLTGNAQNWRQMTADILRSIAQMITKMLIMTMVIKGLEAMGIPAGAMMNMMYGGRRTGAPAPAGGDALAGLYATGGIANSPQIAIFGEGSVPEAFVPMPDGRTIQMGFDSEGNPVVLLPGGRTIPVTIKNTRKFATGGVIIPPGNRRAADSLSGMGGDALTYRNGQLHAGGSVTNINVNITISGDASREDAEAIGAETAKQIKSILDAQEAERRRQAARGGNFAKGYIDAGG